VVFLLDLGMKRITHSDLIEFENLFNSFNSIPRWIKEKHKRFKILDNFLSEFYSFNIGETKSSIHKGRTHTFTIFKVPKKRTGKLFKYRECWVLSRKRSLGGGGWGKFWDEIYPLDFIPTEKLNTRLIKDYPNYYIDNFNL